MDRGARVLVACSGGPDSAALLHVLTRLDELELDLRAASVDHGLRAEAARDVAVAGELAERLGVPFRALAVRVAAGASVQAQAREARYGALLEHARQLGAATIAVGHTLDDQAETVLSRLLRGASLAGLGGIEPARADGVVRPLLDCRRGEVRAHVARFGLPHVQDPSNADPRFERVRVRERLMPALALENEQVPVHLARLADEARVTSAWIDELADRLLERRTQATELWLEGPAPVSARAIKRWIEEVTGRPAKRAHVEALQRTGEVLLPGGYSARRRGAQIVAVHAPGGVTRSRPAGAEDRRDFQE